METKKLLVFLATLLVLTAMSSFVVSAQDIINTTTVRTRIDGHTISSERNFGVVAGESYNVMVSFDSLIDASDAEVSAWIQTQRSGRVDSSFVTDLKNGTFYPGSKNTLRLTIPEKIEPTEELTLYVRIETDKGNWEESYTLIAQRESHKIDVLLVDMDNSIMAGETLRLSVVLKNVGSHISEDTMIKVRIPELGISRTTFFEDLAPVRVCDGCEIPNTRERILPIVIPEKSVEGIYTVEITAYNDQTEKSVVKTLRVQQPQTEGTFIANPAAKNFAVGEEAVYELILVNTGDNIVVYNLAPETNDALTISLSESIVVVPAGSSQTVNVYVKANREGTFGFGVNVNADGLSDTARYNASVEGRKLTTSGNNLIAITIILAIIFLVLLVILVVLLTRRTEKTEDFGESYY